ncbi:MAG: hypothetical protein K9M45_07655 [Kiritimatiellales bacterium]|nr:hypothetical protein [Kiritimatiellales bacterium]
MQKWFLKLCLFAVFLVVAVPRISGEICSSSFNISGLLESAVRESDDAQEQAVLRGMLWQDEFVQDDDNLHFIFSDYLLMLNELAQRRPGAVADGAREMLYDAFDRGSLSLPEIFEPDAAGKWDFISILSLIERWGISRTPYLDFYRQNFPHDLNLDYSRQFDEALECLNYDDLGDILIDTSFAHFFRKKFPDSEFDVPETGFTRYLAQVAGLPYTQKYTKDKDAYSDQNYYVTHVVFTAMDYGLEPMPAGALSREIRSYIESEFACVRHQVGDIDLIAEFVYCAKACGLDGRPEVQEAVDYLLSLQHEDGSWGTDEDFEGDAYDIFHPTWTVITALNY